MGDRGFYNDSSSMLTMNVQDVFTPGDYPEYTYVERRRGELETRLEHQLRRPGAIVSLSGPSKSGKSVLVERVVGSENLVSVYGGEINSVEDLWNQVLDELGAPQSKESVSGTAEEIQASSQFGIRSYLFSASGSVSGREETSEETVEVYKRRGLDDIIDVNNKDSFVLLIDDFHYLNSELQTAVGEALKQASEEGLKICVALIPHRSDDLTQANPDLQGRALTFELEYWEREDLKKIGNKGFDSLNIEFSSQAVDVFAKESAGSPQLMQQLCYDACGRKGIAGKQTQVVDIDMSQKEILDVLLWTGTSIDLNTVFEILNGEGISGKRQRKTHEFNDGDEGDVYEAILRGIASDPLQVSFNRSELIERIEHHCSNTPPRTPSITQALGQMHERISNVFPESTYLEWDDETNTLQIPDPYLTFYLRWSNKLSFTPELEI